jgi:hypothetical protein
VIGLRGSRPVAFQPETMFAVVVANMPQLCVTAYGCIMECSLRTTWIVSQIDYYLSPQRRRWPSTAGGRRVPRGVISVES